MKNFSSLDGNKVRLAEISNIGIFCQTATPWTFFLSEILLVILVFVLLSNLHNRS